MGIITVRNFDDALKERLRVRAAKRGHSMEAEVRSILKEALGDADEAVESFGDIVRQHYGPENGIDITSYLPEREIGRPPPDFS